MCKIYTKNKETSKLLKLNTKQHKTDDNAEIQLPGYMTGICEPRSTFPDTLDGVDATGTSNDHFYQNSLFIQGIPLFIKRQQILGLVQNEAGFIKMILSDPIRNPRRVRYGWVYFNNRDVCEKLVRPASEGTGGINGMQITPQFNIRMLPKQKSRRTPKFTPPESMYPYRVACDIKQAYQLCCKFDKESLIYHNPSLNPKFLNSLEIMRRLNVLLLYLRHIHFLCYYCGKHFLSEEHMFARCSAFHVRKHTNDLLQFVTRRGSSSSSSSSSNNENKSAWEKDVDRRIEEIILYGEAGIRDDSLELIENDEKEKNTNNNNNDRNNTTTNNNGARDGKEEQKKEEENNNWVSKKQLRFFKNE